jgi:hypothetical protein
MKTFIQFVNEAVQPPAEKPVEKARRKIAGRAGSARATGEELMA